MTKDEEIAKLKARNAELEDAYRDIRIELFDMIERIQNLEKQARAVAARIDLRPRA